MGRQRRWIESGTITLLVVLLMALAMPRATSAGGVAVMLDAPPRDLQANVAFTVGLTIRSAHEGHMVLPDLRPLIIASRVGSTEKITAQATEEGEPGHYVVTLTLPAAGAWRWEIAPFAPGDQAYRLSLPGPLEVLAKGAMPPAEQLAGDRIVQDAKALDSVFDPASMTVPAGTTVVWHNAGKLPHTVTAADGLFASGNLEPGAEWSYTFAEPGTYDYYCEYHAAKPAGRSDGDLIPVGLRLGGGGGHMVGKVVVTARIATQVDAAAAPETPALPRTGNPAAPFVLIGLMALLAASVGLLLRRRMGA